MAMEIEQPESIEGGGQFLDKPGIYHFLVTAVDENPTTREGEPLSATKVSLSVLAGTHADQKDKTFDLMLWNPKPEDSSDMPKKKQTRFCLATNLLDAHTPGKRVAVDPLLAVGRQLVAKFGCKQKKNDTTGKWEDTDRVDLHFADIWHVDDEDVKKNNVPLDQSAIKAIPQSLRRIKPDSNGGSSSVKVPPKNPPSKPAAAAVSAGAGIDDV